jgi:type VI secretion system protein ImpF
MANRIERDQPLLPSILDRLIDDDPDADSELPLSQAQVLSQLRESVRRDLENLLNTPWRWQSWSPELRELTRSLVAYGIPDVAAENLGSTTARQDFFRVVERVVRTFETRFSNVRIEPVDNVNRLDRTLRFRIHAMLHAFPAPEPVVFDSALDASTGTFEVTGE